MSFISNPALEEIKAKVTQATKGKEALEIAKGEFVKNMVQRGRLHEKWMATTSYLCLILCLWEGLNLNALYTVHKESGLSHPNLTLALQHATSALLTVVLAAGLAMPSINKNRIMHFFMRAIITSLVAIEVGLEVNCYRNGLRAAMNQKHLHYPLSTLIYALHAIQLKYMKKEKERNDKIFVEIDQKIKDVNDQEEKGGSAVGAKADNGVPSKRKGGKKK